MSEFQEQTKLPSPFGIGPILIVTATEIETNALHEVLTPLNGASSIIKEPRDAHTYYQGILGNSSIVHVQCTMGSSTPGGSIISVYHAINEWKPCAVIMVGIAFGVDEEKQRIADVLVSRQIVSYEPRRVGANEVQVRGARAQAGPILLNYFTNAKDWTHQTIEGHTSTIIEGDLLSGEKLIDNKDYRDQLIAEFHPVVGGEMEGCGLMVAARSGKIQEWIVVKGICDFADGNKGLNKKERQILAAKAAVSLCKHVLRGIRCVKHSIDSVIAVNTEESTRSSEIFFTSYKMSSEAFYHERNFDQFIASILRQGSNIWIHGVSGVGKTVALQRVASKLGLDCIYVDLSSSVNAKPEELLEDAYCQIAEVLGLESYDVSSVSVRDSAYWVRAISNAINKKLKVDTLLIVDEFSLKSASDFDLFLDHIIALILKLTNLNITAKLHLAIASIVKPIHPNNPLFAKVNDRIPVIEVAAWDDASIEKLASIINKATGMCVELAEIQSLKIKTPRKLKTIFRLHLFELKKNPFITLTETVDLHKDELL